MSNVLSDNLTTRENVKRVLNIADTVTGYDYRIDLAIPMVTYRISNYCNRAYMVNAADASVTGFYDGDGKSSFFHTEEYPIQSVSELYDDVDRNYSSNLTENTDYLVYPEEGKIERLSGSNTTSTVITGTDRGVFARGRRNIKVVYVPGYKSVPSDLEHAAIMLVAAFLNKTRGAGLTRTQMGQCTADFELSPMPHEVKQILAKYKKVT